MFTRSTPIWRRVGVVFFGSCIAVGEYDEEGVSGEEGEKEFQLFFYAATSVPSGYIIQWSKRCLWLLAFSGTSLRYTHNYICPLWKVHPEFV